MRVVASNRFEELVDIPQRGVIVFPNKQVKEAVMMHLAMRDGVAMGPRFLELGAAIRFLAPHLRIPSVSELALHIEWELRNVDEVEKFVAVNPEKRRQYLSRELATAILECEQHGGTFSRWQKTLRDRLFKKWDSPRKLLEIIGDTEVTLFAIPYLPPLLLEFFEGFQTTRYCICPCKEFWGDVASFRERATLLKKSDSPDELDAYMQNDNPLLSNWGTLAKDQFDECEERYVEPEGKSGLEKVQKEILLMEQGGISDASIQVHKATSKLREVEVMRAILMGLLAEGNLVPSDIAIYAPDISEYAPFIELCFDGVLPYHIHGLELSSQDEDIQGFLALLEVMQGRFEVEAIVKLATKDALLIEEWAKAAGVKWGFDAAHRDEILGEKMLERGDYGTWSHLFKRLMKSLATNADIPIDFSQAEAAGRMVRLLEKLRRDTKSLQGEKPIDEWIAILQRFVNEYLPEKIEIMPSFRSCLDNALYPFSSIEWVVKREMTKKVGRRGPPLESMRCQSITTPVPAKIVYVLGMDEESFPKQSVDLSITRWRGYSPTHGDEQRYHFLELLLSARSRFICSYEGEKGASSVLQDLISYVGCDVRVHPPFPFHKSYFNEKSDVRSYSEKEYEAAKNFYEGKKQEDLVVRDIKVTRITTWQLRKLARNPIQFYLNESLGIYLDKNEEDQSEFVLSGLTKFMILTSPFDQVIGEAKKEGKLPLGPFASVAERQLLHEQKEIASQLSHLGISEISTQDVELKVGDVIIDGSLENVTPKGMLHFGEGKLSDLLSLWPLALVYGATGGTRLFFAKSKTVVSLESLNCLALLEQYITYYKKALLSPSPLLPGLGEALLEKGEAEFVKAAKASISSKRPYVDRYVKWGLGKTEPKQLYEEWAELLRDSFDPLVKWREHATI